MTRILYLLIAATLLIGTASAYTVDGYDTYYTDGGPAFLRIYGTAPPGEDLRCVIDGIDISNTTHTKADTTTRYTVTFAIPPGNGHYTVSIYTGYTYRTGMGARVSMDEAPWLNEGIKGIRPPPVPAIMKPDTTHTPVPDTTYAPPPAQTPTPTLTPEPTSDPTPASAIKVQPASNTTTLNTSSTLRWDAGAGRLIPNTPRPVQEQDHELNNNLWIACIAVCGIGVLVYLFRS